ncbi:hypothetical protein BO99DRAFT_204943 [Aspergillus violaceofuscus CBS 115571]|uniref:Uncharacterized protein n=1 Tax=Aspergillus violaceofuscus (strain CBS 115571) TaxID=1450538 RepID=A0A2V5H519_ASPV1|nr:hypothetical protein BO99DRAFT_204943 [Aspergillus violaceofuscus CBS 115571]
MQFAFLPKGSGFWVSFFFLYTAQTFRHGHGHGGAMLGWCPGSWGGGFHLFGLRVLWVLLCWGLNLRFVGCFVCRFVCCGLDDLIWDGGLIMGTVWMEGFGFGTLLLLNYGDMVFKGGTV